MTQQFGLTPTGFVPMQQQDVVADLTTGFQAAYGSNVNTSDESMFGQLIGIFSERNALLWQLGQATYANTYPSGATGTSVDNILAILGLERGEDVATKTNPAPVVQSNGITLNGLVLYGTPGYVVPKNSLISNGASPAITFATDQDITIAAGANAVQSVLLSNTPTAGSFQLSIMDPDGMVLTTPVLPYNVQATQTLLSWPPTPTPGTYFLTLGSLTTTALQYNATAAQVQAAINALGPYANVMVAGSYTAGMTLVWPTGYIPIVSTSSAASGVAPTVTNGLQAVLASSYDSANSVYPFTDVAISATANGFSIAFGALTPQTNQPSSGQTAQPLMTVASTTLVAGNTATNITILDTINGSPAFGSGTATCTATGPNFVAAGSLTTIVNSQTGWTGVNNLLDCITGSNAETDSAALIRASSVTSARGSTSLMAVVQRLLLLNGVSAALGFANTTGAAQQNIKFGAAPTAGAYQIALSDYTTASLPYTTTAAQLQNAIRALPGYGTALVTGSVAYGFVLDFNGSNGGQAQPLVSILNNTTGATITPSYGRPPHSIELVVQGGSNIDIANTILAAAPAGIGTYSAPVLQTLASVNVGSATMAVASTTGVQVGQGVVMYGVAPGTTVSSVSGSNVILSAPAIGTYSNMTATFNYVTQVTDAGGNPQLIGFSRPTQIPIYVSISLVTDQYVQPGNRLSGVNPAAQWTPTNVAQIQADIMAIGNAIGIGGLVVGFGSNGLIGAFNEIPGIVSYQLAFDVVPNPVNTGNIQMLTEQVPSLQSYNIQVSYT